MRGWCCVAAASARKPARYVKRLFRPQASGPSLFRLRGRISRRPFSQLPSPIPHRRSLNRMPRAGTGGRRQRQRRRATSATSSIPRTCSALPRAPTSARRVSRKSCSTPWGVSASAGTGLADRATAQPSPAHHQLPVRPDRQLQDRAGPCSMHATAATSRVCRTSRSEPSTAARWC